MYVEFKKLRFKNILSYGNSFTEVDFQKGINLIKAANGSGKSTMLDAMTFCLFGKPYRDIKLAKLVNETNEKDLVTEVEFQIGKDLYKIVRGLKPALFQIFKNNSEIDLLSSKKLNQDEIDKLLGINLRLFKNIVCIAATNNKPFLSLSIGDKRLLMENVFNIDVLGDICKDVKKRRTVATADQQLKLSELGATQTSIDDNNKYIANMQKYISEFNSNKEAEIGRIRGSISETEGKLSKARKNVTIGTSALEKKVQELGTPPDSSVYGQLSSDLGGANADVSRIQKTLNNLASKSDCPICGSPLNEGHAKKHIDQLNKELKKLTEKTIPSLNSKIDAYKAELNAYNKEASFIETLKDKTRQEQKVVDQLQYNLEALNESLSTAEAKECNISLVEYENRIIELNNRITEITNLIDELQHKIDIDNVLVDVLGDTGVKQYFFRKLIMILNKNINEYLKAFELPISLTFDEQMQETIARGKYPRDYEQFSGGERSRVDMAIILSFFNTSRIISNWSCNVLVCDELFDNGIDQSGIDLFLATMYNLISDKKNKLGIYIISHKLNEPKIPITSTIEITKKPGGFSTLEVK